MGQRPGYRRGAWLGELGLALIMAATPSLQAQSGKPAGKSGKSGKSVKAVAPADEPSSEPDEATPSKPGGLRMSRAVICSTIDGYEKYKPLPGAAQTSEEKLLVYYRPLYYKTDFVDGYYLAHVSQDNEIRKRGEKKVVRQKKKVVDYAPKTKQQPPQQLYIRNTISLKGLDPGDYELTIILRDELDKEAPATRQMVKFKIVPPDDPRSKTPAEKSEDPPPE